MRIGQTFASLEEVEIAIQKFSDDTFTHLTKTDSCASDVDGVKYAYIVYKCVQHHDPAKVKSKSNGTRPHQSYNASNCPLTMRITYDKKKSRYLLKSGHFEHCLENEPPTHPVSKELYDFHINSRRLNAEEQKMVLELLENDTDAKKVCQIMRKKTGKPLVTKDIHNCRATLKLKNLVLSDKHQTIDQYNTTDLVKISNNRTTRLKHSPTADKDRILSNKYTLSLGLCQELSQSICRGDEDEYNERIEVLKLLTSMWNDGLKVELRPVSFGSSAKSSQNTSLGISTMPLEVAEPELEQLAASTLIQTSDIHNDNVRRGRSKQIKASQSQLVRVGKKPKIDTKSMLLDYINGVSLQTFKSIPIKGSPLIDEDDLKVQSNVEIYDLHNKLIAQGVELKEFFTQDALNTLESNYNLTALNAPECELCEQWNCPGCK